MGITNECGVAFGHYLYVEVYEWFGLSLNVTNIQHNIVSLAKHCNGYEYYYALPPILLLVPTPQKPKPLILMSVPNSVILVFKSHAQHHQ